MKGAGFGIAVDVSGNLWSSNFGWSDRTQSPGDIPADGSVTELSAQGAPL